MSFFPSKEYQINPWLDMAVFAILVGPFALSFHMHYPDEMYYKPNRYRDSQTCNQSGFPKSEFLRSAMNLP